jgi:hypothetical protein
MSWLGDRSLEGTISAGSCIGGGRGREPGLFNTKRPPQDCENTCTACAVAPHPNTPLPRATHFRFLDPAGLNVLPTYGSNPNFRRRRRCPTGFVDQGQLATFFQGLEGPQIQNIIPARKRSAKREVGPTQPTAARLRTGYLDLGI